MAEQVARFLTLDLHDMSSGQTVVREAQYLDESLRQRHRRLGLRTQMPPIAPGALASFSRDQAGSSVIEIPPTGSKLAYGMGLLAMVVWYLFIPGRPELGWEAGSLVAAGLFYGVPLLFVLRFVGRIAWYRETITVSNGSVAVHSGTFLRRTRHMAESAIEEVVVPLDSAPRASRQSPTTLSTILTTLSLLGNSGGIGEVLIRGDADCIGVGRTLSPEEKSWLHAALVYLIASQSGVTVPAAGIET